MDLEEQHDFHEVKSLSTAVFLDLALGVEYAGLDLDDNGRATWFYHRDEKTIEAALDYEKRFAEMRVIVQDMERREAARRPAYPQTGNIRIGRPWERRVR